MPAVLVLGAVAAVAAAVWLEDRMEDSDTARPGMRHAALHLNCPPGSHGVPRYAKFGSSLGYGRDGSKPVRDRGLIATMPARAGTNP